LNFLLDNNLPPTWARALDALSLKQFEPGHVGKVIALRDEFPQNATDTEWLKALSQQGNWAVLSCDFFRKNKAEKELVRSSGLSVFVLPKAWSSQPHWTQTARLIEWWPKIVNQANSVDKACFEIPWRISGRFTQMRL
jgi:PIN like domain